MQATFGQAFESKAFCFTASGFLQFVGLGHVLVCVVPGWHDASVGDQSELHIQSKAAQSKIAAAFTEKVKLESEKPRAFLSFVALQFQLNCPFGILVRVKVFVSFFL